MCQVQKDVSLYHQQDLFAMNIRQAHIEELDAIMSIFELAKLYMHSQGNRNQWGDDYPPRQLIAHEIESAKLFCIEHDGEVAGVFSFDKGCDIEPTYAIIYDGCWQYNEPYGVVHRLASNGKVKGISDQCFDWCKQQCNYLRVDTHRDNATMQQALLRQGFVYSGIIVLSRNGSERLAYEWHDK